MTKQAPLYKGSGGFVRINYLSGYFDGDDDEGIEDDDNDDGHDDDGDDGDGIEDDNGDDDDADYDVNAFLRSYFPGFFCPRSQNQATYNAVSARSEEQQTQNQTYRSAPKNGITLVYHLVSLENQLLQAPMKNTSYVYIYKMAYIRRIERSTIRSL